MAVHVYDVTGRRIYCRSTLAEVKADTAAAGRRRRKRNTHRTTWDDQTGERWEHRAGEWKQTQAPDVEETAGIRFDSKMAAAGEYLP